MLKGIKMTSDVLETKYGNARLNNHGYYIIGSTQEGNYSKLLHRLIFEDFYGMKIPKGYHIHHKNGNKLDNCILNLQLMRESEHHSLHVSGENHPMYGKTHSEESKQKMRESQLGIPISPEIQEVISKKHNTCGYFRVSKIHNKRYASGYYWVYQYYKDGKHKRISSVRLSDLKEKVLSRGLKWLILDEDKARESGLV